MHAKPPRPTASPLLGAALGIAGFLALAGCATPPAAGDAEAQAEFREANDPLEPANRVAYRVTDAVDTAVLRPIASGYVQVVPTPVRTHIHEFLVNLTTPVTLADDMLQGKPRRAGDTLMRGLINTTVGVGGIFDVATDWGYPAHDTDFGVTLALWGLDEGPFLFLPVLGPSNPRDATGFGADIALDPLTWVGQGAVVTALDTTRFAVSAVDTRAAHLDDIDRIKAQALDPYATYRSLYRQHRAAQIEETRSDDRRTVPAWFPAAAPTPPTPTAAAPATN